MTSPSMRGALKKAIKRERAQQDHEMAREGFVRWSHAGAPVPDDDELLAKIFRFRRLSTGKTVRYGPKWIADMFALRAEAKLTTKLCWATVAQAMDDETEQKALLMELAMEIEDR